MKKRWIALMLVSVLTLSLLAGCSPSNSGKNGGENSPEPQEGQQVVQDIPGTTKLEGESKGGERAAATEPVDFIAYGLDFSSADFSPFGPSGSRDYLINMIYPRLIYLPS